MVTNERGVGEQSPTPEPRDDPEMVIARLQQQVWAEMHRAWADGVSEHEEGSDRVSRFSVKAWLVRLIDERIARTLIRWREKGNLLNDEQKAKLDRAGENEEGVTK